MFLAVATLFFFPAYEVTNSPDLGVSLFADAQGYAYIVSDVGDTVFLSKLARDGKLVYRIPVATGYGSVLATTLDSANNVYAVVSYPPPPGALYEKHLAKIDAAGKVLFQSTLPNLYFHALWVSPDGSIYLTGEGYPEDLKTTPGAWVTSAEAAPHQDNAAVVKISPDGARIIFATFLDNSPPRPRDVTIAGTAITVDSAGNTYVAGSAFDPHFPTTRGALRSQCCTDGLAAAFVVKLNPHGTAAIYSTFLSIGDTPRAIRVDSAGNAELTVNTSGILSPTAISTLELSAAGDRVSNLVSTSLDRLQPIDSNPVLDGAGNVLVTGTRVPASLPVTPGALNTGDNFVAVIRAADGAMLFSSRLPNGTGGIGIVPDGNGGFIVLGADNGYRCQDAVPGLACPVRGPYSMLTRYAPASQFRPTVLGVSNVSATIQSWGLAPGEIVNIYGIELGPEHGMSGKYVNGRLPFELGGTQVYFNGIAAPILHAGNNLVIAVVPFELSTSKTATVQLRFNNVEANAAELPVIPRDLEIFRELNPALPNYDFAVAINQNGKPNSAADPAKPGSIVSIFVNGVGALTPEPPDGAAQSIGPIPALPVTVSFGGYSEPGTFVPCEMLYAGAAPKQVAGKIQINFRVPTPQPIPEVNSFALVRVSIGDQQATARIWRQKSAIP